MNAEAYLQAYYLHEGIITLLHHRQIFYGWRGTHYAEITEEEFTASIWAFLHLGWEFEELPSGDIVEVPFKVRITDVRETIAALTALSQISGELKFPHWTGGDGGMPATEVLSCANGLLHIPTRTLVAHSPQFRNTFSVAYAYDPEATHPPFYEALDQYFPEDLQSIDTLGEMFGYFLTPDTSQQKMFLFVGPHRCGKGTIGRILEGLLGAVNVAHPKLNSFGKDFGLQPLINKVLAVVSDARITGRTDIGTLLEDFLSISGEDPQQVNRKNLTHWIGALATRILILTNGVPKVPDETGVFASRFIILQFTHSFFGREDRELTAKLLAGLPAILNFALDGYDRLKARGHFIFPESAKQALQDFANLSNPVGEFGTWRTWAELRRLEPYVVGSSPGLGVKLHAIIPTLRTDKFTLVPKGKQERCYIGLRLKEAPGKTKTEVEEAEKKRAEAAANEAPPLPENPFKWTPEQAARHAEEAASKASSPPPFTRATVSTEGKTLEEVEAEEARAEALYKMHLETWERTKNLKT